MAHNGEGGRFILGSKPSRVLSSGFILPRHDQNGDDESSDIRLASHGMDIRMRASEGVVRVVPTLSVYIRVFPSAEDLFARNGRLIPRAELSSDAAVTAKDEVRRRMAETGQGLRGAARAEMQSRIAALVYREMGIVVPDGALIVQSEDAPAEDGQGRETSERPRLRIPNRLSRQYEAPQKWRRVDVPSPTLDLPLPVNRQQWEALAGTFSLDLTSAIVQACNAYLSSDEGRNWAWRRRRPESEDFWSPDAWNAFLLQARTDAPQPADLIPNIQASLLAQALPDTTAPGSHSVRLALENLRDIDAKFESGLFNVRLEVEMPEGALAPMRLERVKRSYHLAGFMNMPGLGVNGGIDDLGSVDGVRRLRTTWMPRYVLPRMLATAFPTVPTAYARLSEPDQPIDDLFALVRAMDEWRQRVAAETNLALHPDEGDAGDERRQREQFQNDMSAWGREARRVELGLETLMRSQAAWRVDRASRSAIPFRAWLSLNRSFHRANRPREGSPQPGWRLFQLAFILAHVPTLASKLPEFHDVFQADFDEESVSLLYMSTGGGKTEAFFGTVVFGLFLDRLRGKHRGVTAMMHYPLRLLTVQQAQRLARLMAHAEMVRRELQIPGAPFEIGFWVGGGNTPNRTERLHGVVRDELAMIPAWNSPRARSEQALLEGTDGGPRGYATAQTAWNKLPTCPFCRSEHPTALRLFPEEHNRLGIVCLDPDCDWNIAHLGNARPEPLPFLLVDSDIYRRSPSVLLGTIDKLALIGQNVYTIDAIAGMFGMARAVEQAEPHLVAMPTGRAIPEVGTNGTNGVSPAYQGGEEIFYDPFPSLIVQDEMHLLEESLGTFGGIFETGLFAWLKRLARFLGPRAARLPDAPDVPRLPHVIGATATVSDAAKHARALYQRRVGAIRLEVIFLD